MKASVKSSHLSLGGALFQPLLEILVLGLHDLEYSLLVAVLLPEHFELGGQPLCQSGLLVGPGQAGRQLFLQIEILRPQLLIGLLEAAFQTTDNTRGVTQGVTGLN